jgi:hypothetical protein
LLALAVVIDDAVDAAPASVASAALLRALSAIADAGTDKGSDSGSIGVWGWGGAGDAAAVSARVFV